VVWALSAFLLPLLSLLALSFQTTIESILNTVVYHFRFDRVLPQEKILD